MKLVRESGALLAVVLAGGLAGVLAARRQTQEPPQAPGKGVLISFDESEETGVPALAVGGLRCEYREEPLALETPAPRFSWTLMALDPARRAITQAAYRIVVSSSPAELAREQGDLWDTGTVAARETVDIPYEGRALRAFEQAWWKVRVADHEGLPSEWSAPARFGMGALSPADWSAQWIGYDAPRKAVRPVPDLGSTRWLTGAGAPREVWLRRRFEHAGALDTRTGLLVAAADEAEVFLNGKSVWKGSSLPGARRNAEVAKISQALVQGSNVLAARVRAATDSQAALCLRLLLTPEVGGAEVTGDELWRASSRPADSWSTADFDDSAWEPATLVEGAAWLPEVDAPALSLPAPRLLRTEFTARSAPVRATLYASALGVYSVELNGARAHDDWLAPGWTDYTRRIPYRAHDVTTLVRPGANALGVVLADGWYAGLLGQRGQRDHYGEATRFLGQLVLEHADGTREVVASGPEWKAAIGPWREADLYLGERYDARLEQPGWSAPGLDAAKWRPVDVGAGGAAPLAAHLGATIRAVAELEPVERVERAPGEGGGAGAVRFDFGQNLAGVARLALEAPAGTALVLRFAEALEPDGQLMRRNLSWARATDQYVCRGGGPETWQPRFTYHGFRYVELAGLPSGVEARVTALVLSGATRMTGEFRCSDPLVNRLVENVRWTLRANSMDVPTDCPQRGERLGWTGDAQLFAPSALWLADLHALYDKWGRDLLDAQRPDGRFPSTAPALPGMPNGGPAWEDAGVLVPARVFEVTGDRRLAERHLESMRRFVASYEARSGPEFRPPAEIEGFGDWHALAGETPREVLYLASFARSARRLAELERTLGNAAEAERAQKLAGRAVRTFASAFVDREGRVRGETQTAYALALNEGLIPNALSEVAGARLLADLERHGGLTTGYVGTAELLPALTALGQGEVAYRLLRSRAFPSWGYMIEQGATTVWEQWDAWRPETGIARNGRASLNHTPLAAVVAWLFESVAGIRPAAPGFASVELAPLLAPGLDWAEARYDSVRGRIALRWERAGEELRLEVEVPPNVTATLSLDSPGPILEGGSPLTAVKGVRELARFGTGSVLTLQSGRYSFTTRSR